MEWDYRRALRSQRLWIGTLGLTSALAFWYASVRWLPVAEFHRLPGPIAVFREWFSTHPAYGVSIFTRDYYVNILYSTVRAWLAFFLAVILGVPLGIFMGWKPKFREYASALVGLFRPVPPLAWVPLAILLLPGTEPAVIFVTFLVAFFATTMNTLLGVRSIDDDYFRAAQCLGASPSDVLRDVIIPGALPNIFTGLQIAMGAAWFSLVAGEMVAAQYGLGYLIWNSYNLIEYPVIVVGMATLGIIGYLSSVCIRWVGNRLMQWREQSMGL